jgi:hypothetical protein
MFHWICPECGREIPPSVRECQVCDPQAAALAVVEPIESKPVADAVPTPPPLPELVKETAPVQAPAVEAQTVEPVVEKVEPVAETPVVTEAAPAEPQPEPVVEKVEPVAQTPVVAEAAPVEPQPEPVIEKVEPVAQTPVVAEAQPAEPVLETASAPVEPSVEKVEAVAQTPVVVEETPAEPAVEAASSPVEPLVEKVEALAETPAVAEAPPTEPVIEEASAPVEPVIEKVEPVAQAPVVTEATPVEPVVEAASAPVEPVVEKVEAVAQTPVVAEAAPVEPVVEAASTPVEPVVEKVEAVAQIPVVAEAAPAEPVVAASSPVEPLAEAIAQTPVVAEATPAEPVVETASAPVEPLVEKVEAVAPTPVVAEAPPVVAEAAAPEVDERQEAPIKLHDVPDPLLALAEEIRAAQAARAAAQIRQPNSDGLLELSEAVGTQQVEPAAPVQKTEPVSAPVEPSVPAEQSHVVEEVVAAAAVAATAVALLAPPEHEPAPSIAPEPVGFHELRPAALAPELQPAAEPEPVALAEPQSPPAVLAPEPQPELEGPTLPFAPMQNYTPATSRSIMPVPPPQQILSADSGPRITLPGPTLPPELTRLQDANVVTVIGEDTAQRTKEAIPPAKRDNAPGWLVSAFVALLLLAAGLGIVFYLLPRTVADAKPAPIPAVAATTPAPTGGNSPLAKFIEVTGFRIVTSSPDATKKDAPKKSEVQYLIVNHSDADISDANVFVTLRSVKPGQPPVCRFSFKVPSLGPFESKEMSSPIGNSTRAISLPDWQEIRAEVQISQ